MARGRTPYLPALVVAGVLVACAVAVLGLSEKAEATFPGKNGRIAYMGKGGIYTIYPGGGDRAQLTHNRGSGWPSYSPNGKKIVYKGWDGHDDEIYTMNAGGGVRSNSPTTMEMTGLLPTRPTARRSSMRASFHTYTAESTTRPRST
jgi:hypothetical protein